MNTKNTLITAILLSVFLSSPAISQDELLIIAPDEFIDELLPLMSFKEASARPTILLRLSQVYNLNFQGDEAEQIKRCIALYEQALGIDHVLLVGDVDKFPVRWRWWGLINQEYWGVSDLYYADLYENGTTIFDDWDFNNNGLYGEIEFDDGTINNDEIDFLPDVSVGRIPASTPNEVTAYVNKVIDYELQTTPSDTWFKTASLFTGTENTDPCLGLKTAFGDVGPLIKDKVDASLSNRGITTVNKRYDIRNYPDPVKTFLEDANDGLGFVNYLGHGNTSSWEGWINTFALTRLDNQGKLPVVFAGACETGMFAGQARFHAYIDVNGVAHCGTVEGEVLDPGPYPHPNLPKPDCLQHGSAICNTFFVNYDKNCIAEKFLFGNPTGSGNGAIAYLGERTGGRITIVDLDEYFFEAYEQGNEVLGEMWKYMLEEYYTHHNLADSNTWASADWRVGHTFDEPQKLIFFGDPSLIVGGAFRTAICGNVYDGSGGPLQSGSRTRITCNVTIPTGQRLTAYPGASVVFDDGKKITAMDTNPGNGLIVDGSVAQKVCFLSNSISPQNLGVCGVKVTGQIRIRNGGAIKMY